MNPDINHRFSARALPGGDCLRNPIHQWVIRRQKTYILLSHVLGRDLPSAKPENWAYLEQAMAQVLQDGLYSPFHIKTLKKLTGAKKLGPCTLCLLQLLQAHACTLLKGRSVVLVVDDVSDLGVSELEQAQRLLTELTVSGFKVLVQDADSELVSIEEIAPLQPCISASKRTPDKTTKGSFHERRIALLGENAI